MALSRRTILVFVLALLLAAPWASAAPRADAGPREALTHLWSLLASLWSEAGCELDPDGRCAPDLPDAGCEADPDGRCLPEQESGAASDIDVGCEIDPSGRPSCGG